jgi:isoaspartyl peptidase/L-asparaginase-like protein (Ntn-hydrolase superfamily)
MSDSESLDGICYALDRLGLNALDNNPDGGGLGAVEKVAASVRQVADAIENNAGGGGIYVREGLFALEAGVVQSGETVAAAINNLAEAIREAFLHGYPR